jgi:hypothetical protein
MKAILPVHVIQVELNLGGLPNHLVCVSHQCGEDDGVLEFNVVVQVDAVFSHGGFQTGVSLAFLHPGFDVIAGLPFIDLTTLTGHAVHSRSLMSQVILHRLKKAWDLLRGLAHRLDIMPGEQPADVIQSCTHVVKEGTTSVWSNQTYPPWLNAASTWATTLISRTPQSSPPRQDTWAK